MSKPSLEIIQNHLNSIEEAVRELNKASKFSAKKFKETDFVFNAILHDFQIALENIFDIGNHILAAIYGKGEEEYANIIPALLNKKVISATLAQNLTNIAGFRNKIVHGYIGIDADAVYSYLSKVKYFKHFAEEIIKYLERNA